MPLFTPETAAALGRKGALARWSKPPPPPDPPPLPTPIPDHIPEKRRLARVLKQIDALDDQLDNPELDPKEWDMLTRAKERLFKAWVHLAGIPGPGHRRPAPERSQSTPVRLPDPVEPVPPSSTAPIPPLTQPAAPPAITPLTTDRLPGDVTP